jgi:hypothetical protein
MLARLNVDGDHVPSVALYCSVPLRTSVYAYFRLYRRFPFREPFLMVSYHIYGESAYAVTTASLYLIIEGFLKELFVISGDRNPRRFF